VSKARRLRKQDFAKVDGDLVAVEDRVQGIAKSIDDIKIFGRGWRETITESVLERPKIKRTIEGASAVEVPVSDKHGTLRRSSVLEARFDIELDGLFFRLVKVGRHQHSLTLTFEDREVAILRDITGALKARNAKVTTPEFARQIVRQAKPHIPFYCPQLHKRVPIHTAAEARSNDAAKRATRQPGFGSSSDITVKGEKADSAQIHVIETTLDVGSSLKAPEQVMVAAVMCVTQENDARNSGSAGAFQQNPDWPGDARDVANAARNFYARAPTYKGGAIAYFRKHPRTDLGTMVQAIQQSAFPSAYAKWEHEASRTVHLYSNGSRPIDGTDPQAAADANRQKPLERKPKENSWDCLGRLAGDISWRRYVSAGIVYFISEPAAFASMPRMTVAEGAPGIESIDDWDYDLGKPITELTVHAFADAWEAPPGTAVDVEDQGPADGQYIVSDISTTLRRRNSLCDITLKRPTFDIGTDTSSGSGGATSSSGTRRRVPGRDNDPVSRMIAEVDRIDKLHLPYKWGGSHGSGKTPPNGPFDCSSFVSHILQVGGFLNATLVSGDLAHWGKPGQGKEFTVYANASHVFIVLRGRTAQTSVTNPRGGPGWTPFRGTAGFEPRHAEGY
jgi:cell wall-associated NlpC family hydrolase